MGFAYVLQKMRSGMIAGVMQCGLVSILGLACIAQTGSQDAANPIAGPEQIMQFAQQLGPLFERLQRDVQFPPARTESRLLPLLPESTVFYAALPNYGETAHQALKTLRQELQDNASLRQWWQQGDSASAMSKIEDYVEKFYLVSQYLGDEIVISGTTDGKEPILLLVAEVRKPGLKIFLQQLTKELGGGSKPGLRVLEPQELATAAGAGTPGGLHVLVRPDLVVGALDMATLRRFNAALDSGRQEFLSNPFGQRLAQSYDGGVTLLAGADLQQIIGKVPSGTDQSQAMFQRTGFADLKYAIWEHKNVAGQDVSQMELSFTRPRHGIASWLGAPTMLGSLDFVAPKPMMVASVVLANPAQMFDDIHELATASNPNALASVTQFEQALQLSLRDDVLRQLGGEITVELDSVAPAPVWKAMLRVNHPGQLLQTLNSLLKAAQLSSRPLFEGGVTYHPVRIPSGKTTVEVEYAFADGYLIVGSSHAAVADAIRLHNTGESLGRSKDLAAALPPGHPGGLSAMWYQDPIAMATLQMQQIAPGMAAAIAQSGGERKPAVMCLYGDETAIRQMSTSGAMDAGAVLTIAAIAIPNLLRSRVAANEASAVGTIRSVVTAQVTYQATYPARGFAPSLATLGPPANGGKASANRAGFLVPTLANATCTAGAWCTKSGFRFTVSAACKLQRCREFVVVGTPAASNTGGKSFCATSDGVVRFKAGAPLTSPVSASQCRQWAPLR